MMKIYNQKYIITGLVIFLGLVTFPFWYAMGKAAPAPKPSLDTPVIQKMEVKQCVEATPYMRTSHMQLLNDWRTEVVRNGQRRYISDQGNKPFNMSLQNSCMECHSSKVQFCDKCHNYAGVAPYCWTCHIEPKENK